MYFTRFLQNWLIDTSESSNLGFYFYLFGSFLCTLFHQLDVMCLTEIELVDTQDCFALAFVLVMLHQWPISSKQIYFLNCSFFSQTHIEFEFSLVAMTTKWTGVCVTR